MVPIIAKAPVEPSVRQQWLQRLWQALQDDNIPYIEELGDYWGDLCANAECASQWADEFRPSVEQVSQASGYAHFKGSSAYLSSLFAAGRYEELLSTLEKPYFSGWWYRQWGVQALLALDRKADALRYAEDSKKIINTPLSAVAKVCEGILLSSGLQEEAYNRYALDANQGTTYLATFRGLVKKYPHKPPEDILSDLVASEPGSEGKWFAAAKDEGLFDMAIEIVNKSPADPRTLIRACRDYVEKQPHFAMSAGMAALYWMARGYGYKITDGDVLDAYSALINAAKAVGVSESLLKAQIRDIITEYDTDNNILLATLRDRLII